MNDFHGQLSIIQLQKWAFGSHTSLRDGNLEIHLVNEHIGTQHGPTPLKI
jgi:hypothetical protein